MERIADVSFSPFRTISLLTVTALTLTVSGLAIGAKPQPQEPKEPITAVAVKRAAPIAWADLTGKAYSETDFAKQKATVFIFTSTQCPIAGKYGSRLNTIGKEYAAKGVAFFLVNANGTDTPAAFTKWAKERGLNFPLVKDKGTALADRLDASATPSCVVVDANGITQYLGRIDDSPEPQKVSRRDLDLALDDVLAGRSVKVARTRPFGCSIFRDTAPVSAAKASSVTYAKDIAPILEENCVTCHRTGDVGPFPLDSYEQAKIWSAAIKDYTARRIMPPWKATPGHGDFHDARWLTDAQLERIATWADGGATKGDLKQLPPKPVRHAAGGWALGKPDMVLKAVRPYRLEAEGKDVYRNFTMPMEFTEDTYISAFDFKPSNRAIVHHVIAYIDKTGATCAARDNKETEPGWSVSGGGSGIKDDDWGDGWAPGMTPRPLAPGIAVKVPKGAKLVLQVHYHKTGKPEVDQTELAIYKAKGSVKEVLQTFAIGNPFFALKPGVAGQEVKSSFVLPYNVTLRQILPHMHMLGTSMKVTATLPDGTVKPLIWIQNWDFNWQYNYRYKEPLALPKGTRLNLVATYDNTASNPNQPSHPPQLVRFGEQTTDEMCFAFLGVTIDGNKTAPTGSGGSL
jgi:peroxiredoxin/mono/diheme cytochrome c family protein